MKMSRLMVVGDGNAPTGIARVIKSILINLPHGEYEIHHLAVNYNGDPHGEAWRMYPAGSMGDVYGYNRIVELAKKINPKLIFIVNDPWVVAEYLELLAQAKVSARIVVYMAVDSGPLDRDWLSNYGMVDKFVVYTNYAKTEFLKATKLDEYKKLFVLPHGIDKQLFYPTDLRPIGKNLNINSALEAKKHLKFYDKSEDYPQSFIVLNANRNQVRKRIDITIKGFALFAKNKPKNVNLYLHMGIQDVGWNILKLASRCGISDRLIITKRENNIPAVIDEDLNVIYNACDVGINTSTCEGWGLSNFEHAAARKAQIVTDSRALNEIWNGCAELVKPHGSYEYENILTEYGLVDYRELAAALERLYVNKDHREKVANLCYGRVTRPEFEWKNIAQEWHKIFQSAIN